MPLGSSAKPKELCLNPKRGTSHCLWNTKNSDNILLGRKFNLITDHKPLLTIFHPAKGIPETAASRLQRWAIILSAYDFVVQYKPTTKHGNADGLSRLPLNITE